jgi:hypothetical protein
VSKRGTREREKEKKREGKGDVMQSVPIVPVIVDTQEDLQYSEHTCHLSKAMLNA